MGKKIINTKGLSSVLSVLLFVVIVVLSIFAYQNWYFTFSSELFSNTEQDSQGNSLIDIQTILGNKLYLKYNGEENKSIKEIKIGSKSCTGISQNLSKGLVEVDLGFCSIGADNYEDIVVITDDGVNAKKINLGGAYRTLNLGSNYQNPTPSNGATVYGGDVIINSSSIYDLYSCTLHIDDGGGNVDVNMNVSGKYCYSNQSSLLATTYTYSITLVVDLDGGTTFENETLSQQTFIYDSSETYIINSNVSNLNLFTLAGSPVSANNFRFIITSGTYVYSTSTLSPALITGVFPVGSTLTLINNGSIMGAGGAGGAGGQGDGTPTCVNVAGGPGSPGGDSLEMNFNITIDNTYGQIFAGGGGGGAGGSTGYSSGGYYIAAGGSGGGGGQGYIGGAGGAGGAAVQCGSPFCNPGNVGNSGNITSAGVGGAFVWTSNTGGTGGSWGNPGSPGGAISDPHGGKPPGAGGAAGNAILTNGNTITWLGGNNASNVKGSII